MMNNVLPNFYNFNAPKPRPIINGMRIIIKFIFFKLLGNALLFIENENEERCPICFNIFSKRKVSPNSCNHYFCFSCIKAWRNTRKICPLCRRDFSYILE